MSDKKMSKEELKEKEEEINKMMCENLRRMIGDKHDSGDVAYVMAEAYFKSQDLILKGDKIFDGKKHVATLEVCTHDGKQLKIKIQYVDPRHSIVLDFKEGDNE